MALKVWLPLVSGIYNQGTEITDIIDNGSNPAFTSPTLTTDGPLGGSYSFNGSSNQIVTSYTCAEAAMTTCLWVTFTKINVHLLDFRDSSGNGLQPAYVGSSGIQVGGSNSAWPYINFVPTLDTWYHLCIVYSSSKTQLYVNGELYGETTSSYTQNWNKKLDIHIGSRYSGANWFGGNICDFRVYNEALSPYEIKTIAQGLMVHYTHPWAALSAGDMVTDSSGFGRHATVNGPITCDTTNSNIMRYGKAYGVGSSADNYCYVTSPTASAKTICFWLSAPKTASTVFFADYKSQMAFGYNASGYIIATCHNLNKPMFTNTSAITANVPCHIAIRKNAAGDGVELFVNGVQQTASGSNNNWTHDSDYLMIGRRSSGSPMNSKFSDFRVYAKRLTDAEILDLYHTSLKQLSSGKSSPFEIDDTSPYYGTNIPVKKNGQLMASQVTEEVNSNRFFYASVGTKEIIER